jgi:hypothetical protein
MESHCIEIENIDDYQSIADCECNTEFGLRNFKGDGCVNGAKCSGYKALADLILQTFRKTEMFNESTATPEKWRIDIEFSCLSEWNGNWTDHEEGQIDIALFDPDFASLLGSELEKRNFTSRSSGFWIKFVDSHTGEVFTHANKIEVSNWKRQ